MALPVIADIFRCTFNWQNTGGLLAHSVIHISAPSSDEQDVFDALDASISSTMFATTVSTATVGTVDILALDGTSGTQTFSTISAEWAGESGGQSIVQGCQLVTFKTPVRGPRGRGRIYQPFLSEASQQDGLIVSNLEDACAAAWVTFHDDLIGLSMDHVVASYLHADANVVVNYIGQQVVATQRRRLDQLR